MYLENGGIFNLLTLTIGTFVLDWQKSVGREQTEVSSMAYVRVRARIC